MLRAGVIFGLMLLSLREACRGRRLRDIEGSAVGVARTVDGRPYVLNVPPQAALGKPLPLVIVLHGYGASGQGQSTYFGLDSQVATRGFLLAKPDGTRDNQGQGARHWNAFPRLLHYRDRLSARRRRRLPDGAGDGRRVGLSGRP